MSPGPLLELRAVSKSYRNAWSTFRSSARLALRSTSLELESGYTLGIVGESGSGKTTLARIASALIEPDSGEVFVRGERVSGIPESRRRPMRRHFQMVFQDPFASLNPRMSILEAVAEPIRYQMAAGTGKCISMAGDYLELVGISPSLGRRYPHELSGGQRQRAAIARALVTSPDLIIADEPVSSLDVSIQAAILNLLKDIQAKTRCSYLFISHDFKLVSYMSDRVNVMYDGLTVETGQAEEIRLNSMHPYTHRMISCIPSIGGKGRIPGSASYAPVLVPEEPDGRLGCPYFPRCPWRADDCAAGVPPLKDLPGAHKVACYHPQGWKKTGMAGAVTR